MSDMLAMLRFPLAWAFLKAVEEPRNYLRAHYVGDLDRWRPGIPSIFGPFGKE